MHTATKLASGARGFFLLRHRRIKAGHIHRHPTLTRHVLGEIQREAVGVVQAERSSAGDDVVADAGRHLFENLHARIQRFGEALFFGQQGTLGGGAAFAQDRIGFAHQVIQRGDQFVEERLAHAQHPAVTQRTADNPAQHIAAAFVRRQHTIDNQESAGADVVSNHAQGFVFQIVGGGELGRVPDQALEQIDFIIGMHMLQDRGDALQAHAGIHAGGRQRRQRAVGRTVELHEHVVPDFDETIAIFIRGTGRATEVVRAVIVEDFTARAAGTGIGHLPEIVGRKRRALVVTDADDAFRWQTNLIQPDVVGLVVGVIDRGQQALFRQLPDLGQQLPGPANGFFLEIVTERPVAQHLEEGVVARGVTHRIQIVVFATRTQAALHIGGAHIAALFRTQEHVLELHHAGIGEQQGGVIARHQRRRRHDGMALGGEEVEKVAADIRGGFGWRVHTGIKR